jgi:hypothetical protein
MAQAYIRVSVCLSPIWNGLSIDTSLWALFSPGEANPAEVEAVLSTIDQSDIRGSSLMARHHSYDPWGPDSPRRFFSDQHWHAPILWNRESEKDGIRRRVFCASMADAFEPRSDLDPDCLKGCLRF